MYTVYTRCFRCSIIQDVIIPILCKRLVKVDDGKSPMTILTTM